MSLTSHKMLPCLPHDNDYRLVMIKMLTFDVINIHCHRNGVGDRERWRML